MIKNFAKLAAITPCLLAIVIDVFGYGLVYPIITVIFTNPSNPLVAGLGTEAMRDFFMGLAHPLYPLFMLFGSSFMDQGWVMGIFGATVAISFALVGASTNLLDILGTNLLIAIGGFFRILSGLGMVWYQRARGAQPLA